MASILEYGTKPVASRTPRDFSMDEELMDGEKEVEQFLKIFEECLRQERSLKREISVGALASFRDDPGLGMIGVYVINSPRLTKEKKLSRVALEIDNLREIITSLTDSLDMPTPFSVWFRFHSTEKWREAHYDSFLPDTDARNGRLDEVLEEGPLKLGYLTKATSI
jgi:hypothetical protein